MSDQRVGGSVARNWSSSPTTACASDRRESCALASASKTAIVSGVAASGVAAFGSAGPESVDPSSAASQLIASGEVTPAVAIGTAKSSLNARARPVGCRKVRVRQTFLSRASRSARSWNRCGRAPRNR